MPKLTKSYKQTIVYGLSLAALLILLKWLEFKFIILDHAFEIYAGAIAILFTALGIWLAVKLTNPKVQTVIVEKEIYISKGDSFSLNEKELEKLNLSKKGNGSAGINGGRPKQPGDSHQVICFFEYR